MTNLNGVVVKRHLRFVDKESLNTTKLQIIFVALNRVEVIYNLD